ncbi:MAG TPA: hypothetical protein VHU15_01140 [Stellaceae bacterium]|jgi:hypothetical protein|nr:hypothetical protein [Stellaceae bacterium]
MSKPLIASAAIAALCLLTAASPALAKKKNHHHQWSQQSYASYGSTTPYASYGATTPAAQGLVGRYTSQDFYPNPLVLNITGMDTAGNLSGMMAGMMSKLQNGEDPAYENWQKVFGRDAHAVYRNSQIEITFNNGVTYKLNQSGNQLSGQFADGTAHRSMSFMKSQVPPNSLGY